MPVLRLPAEVALDRISEPLGEIERLRAILWARLTRDATPSASRQNRYSNTTLSSVPLEPTGCGVSS